MSQTFQLQDLPERVAFDLMNVIHETTDPDTIEPNRAYWFKLYHQCIELVVEHKNPEKILSDQK